MQKARELFEKVASSQSDTRDARNLRVKMGMLCRAHLDKSFVTGAEQMASWQELSALAVANGKEKPPLPEPSVFQKIKAGVNDVYVYLPEEYAHEAFSLGARYQRTEMTAIQAIEAMQGLANQICFYELRLIGASRRRCSSPRRPCPPTSRRRRSPRSRGGGAHRRGRACRAPRPCRGPPKSTWRNGPHRTDRIRFRCAW